MRNQIPLALFFLLLGFSDLAYGARQSQSLSEEASSLINQDKAPAITIRYECLGGHRFDDGSIDKCESSGELTVIDQQVGGRRVIWGHAQVSCDRPDDVLTIFVNLTDDRSPLLQLGMGIAHVDWRKHSDFSLGQITGGLRVDRGMPFSITGAHGKALSEANGISCSITVKAP